MSMALFQSLSYRAAESTNGDEHGHPSRRWRP